MANTRKKITRIGIAIFLTFIPIVVFKSVWEVLVNYLPLITAVLLIFIGSFFIYVYIKGYSWGSLAGRIGNLFAEKQDMRGYLRQRFSPDPLCKSKSVVIVGVALIFWALYLLYQYQLTGVDQGDVMLIKELSK